MKTVLCFGDSLVWGGYITHEGGYARHAFEDRFPNVLQKTLGSGGARVVEEGTPARYSAWDGPPALERFADAILNGATVLPTILNTHAPIDLAVFFLGTNDIMCGTDTIGPMVPGTAEDARRGCSHLIELTRRHLWPEEADKAPDILLVAPPPLRETENPILAKLVETSMEQSRRLAPVYSELAAETGCGFFDAGTVIQRTSIDGVHLDAEAHHALGKALGDVVRPMLN